MLTFTVIMRFVMSAIAIENAVFEVTRDQAVMDSYLRLRQLLDCNDERFKGFRLFSFNNKKKETLKKQERMVVIKNGTECVGGAKLSLCLENNRLLLPSELDMTSDLIGTSRKKYLFRNLFPDFHLEQKNYGELGNISLHPDYRDGDYLVTLIAKLLLESFENNLDYLLAMTDKIRWRRYNQIAKKFDTSVVLHKEIEVPVKKDYEGIKMHLISIDMSKVNKRKAVFYANPKSWLSLAA